MKGGRFEILMYNLKGYFSNILIFWLAIFIYRTNGYYLGFLRDETQLLLFNFAELYTYIGLIVYLFFKTKHETKGLVFFRVVRRLFHEIKNKSLFKEPFISKKDKSAILFLIVKFFFLPIMINFVLNNYFGLKGSWGGVSQTGMTMVNFNHIFFPFLITLIFFIDTLFFGFGYMAEAGFLRNKLRSVEPTFFGWFIALICYPPFNGVINNYTNWHADNMVVFGGVGYTFAMRVIIIMLLGIYVFATLALGTKCSNLTNRGIVTGGVYRIVRHPAYISKNLSWWLTLIPVMSVAAFISMFIWSVIYYFRAVTEERHLMADPEYQAYRKKVKWMFIPGVW